VDGEEHVGGCGRSVCGMGGVWEVGYAYLSTTSQPSKKLRGRIIVGLYSKCY